MDSAVVFNMEYGNESHFIVNNSKNITPHDPGNYKRYILS